MIKRFQRVNNNLYRGGAPSIADLHKLKKMGITKIVSLDANAGQHINRACKLLGIKHINIPINPINEKSVIRLVSKHIDKLLSNGGPTFIHCQEGKDRTGFAIAMYRCLHDNWSCKEALVEAKRLGFGTGLPPRTRKFYDELLAKACKKKHNHINSNGDINNADIVSNVSEQQGEYRDYTLDGAEQQSWSPYEDYRVKRWPENDQYINYDETYTNRQNYGLEDIFDIEFNNNTIPMSGIYDQNTQGINGAGPSMVGSGYV